MTTDARALLAKMDADEAAARKAADDLTSSNAAKKKELLQALRDEDLADVRAKCQLHGFTATDLRGVLKRKKRIKKATDGASSGPKTARGRKAKEV